MYRPMLFLHWKQARLALGVLAVAAFALPLFAVQGLGTPPGAAAADVDTYRVLGTAQAWLPFFPLLATAVGITLALSAWSWDHQLKHVYALSLPLDRWEYALHKMTAGATLLLVPAAGMWIGANLAAASLTLPTGLQAYPNELAIRFFFASLVIYGLGFAMSAGSVRTLLIVVGSGIAVLVALTFADDYLARYMTSFGGVDLVYTVLDWMGDAPGPFGILTGSWSLIDV